MICMIRKKREKGSMNRQVVDYIIYFEYMICLVLKQNHLDFDSKRLLEYSFQCRPA